MTTGLTYLGQPKSHGFRSIIHEQQAMVKGEGTKSTYWMGENKNSQRK
jgi:hypothetical protein